MEGDAPVATSRSGDGEGNELAGLFTELAGMRVRGAEHLIATKCVRGFLAKITDASSKILVIPIPIKHHRGISSVEVVCIAAIACRK
jgi:hypothetical protein